MTEKDKQLLKLVGAVVKEKVEEVKNDFANTIKEMTSQYEDKIKEIKEDHAIELKMMGETIDDLSLEKGEKGEKGDSVELEDVITALISDDQFMNQVKGKDGEDGVDAVVDMEKLAEVIKEDELFSESIKGEKGDGVSLHEVVSTLKADESFVKQLKGADGKDGEDGVDATVDLEKLADIIKENDQFIEMTKGEKGDQGEKGDTGEFSKAVSYTGDPIPQNTLVVYKGALWQNLMDDNNTPPSVDNHSYQQLIAKPKDGENGKSVVPKGLYKEDEEYKENDIVMFNNASWIKNSNESQELPGEGWFLLAKAVKGAKGDKGDKGEKGEITDISKDIDERVHKLEVQRIIDENPGK